ncbi:solute carrier organic anion transporter family member 2A1-like isoform X2 [Amphiura filiformis]|uniref:solute carrier organic anion transporter family member 2A1-like isoform X2 n=1 Tax=Amphiura filiformis TaxID=82378 RepID=UPI003B20F21B
MEGFTNVKSISSTMECGAADDIEGQSRNKRTLKNSEKCGLFCFKMPCLQPLAHPVVFVSVVCVFFAFYICAVGGYFGGILSTLEKRFQLSSSEMGSIAIIGDVVGIFLIVPLSYLGQTWHRPRLIGTGAFLVSIGTFICGLPQFLYDTPMHGSIGQSSRDSNNISALLCYTNPNNSFTCTEEEKAISGTLLDQAAFIMIGLAFISAGGCAVLPWTITFIDDSVTDKSSTAVYAALLFIISSIGPILGYALSGACLSRHTDFYKMDASQITSKPGEPGWIGAWWMGFFICGATMLFISIPLFFFPKELPKRPPKVKKKSKNLKKGFADVEDVAAMYKPNLNISDADGVLGLVKGFFEAVSRLVRNTTYMACVLGVCADLASFMGYFTFAAKYIETQFGVSPSFAPMILGIIVTPGACLGSLAGSILVKKYSLGKRGCALTVLILSTITLVMSPVLFFVGCDNPGIAGLTTPYNGVQEPLLTVDNKADFYSSVLPNLTSSCNLECACAHGYNPVCGSDGITYVSPCHAGCQDSEVIKVRKGDGFENITVYLGCQCVAQTPPELQPLTSLPMGSAQKGECRRQCSMIWLYASAAMIVLFLNFSWSNPSFMLHLRAVEENDRSISMGFASLLFKVTGFIPAPIYFGAMIQSNCLMQQMSCGEFGVCQVYDLVGFRLSYHGLMIGLKAISLVGFVVAFWTVRNERQRGFEKMDKVTRTPQAKSANESIEYTHHEEISTL